MKTAALAPPDRHAPPGLRDLELKILQALPDLCLRTSLDRAAEMGNYLSQARGLCTHGQWVPFLKRVGLSRTTAFEYLAVARHLPDANVRRGERITIRRFLDIVRKARYAEKEHERQAARAAAAVEPGRLGDGVTLVHADCREFAWPDGLACVWSDPPWGAEHLPLFRWLAGMAAEKLRDGGLLGVQVGTPHLARVLRMTEDAGLRFVWLLSFSFDQSGQASAAGGCFRPTHRPIALFCKGRFVPPPTTLSDHYTVGSHDRPKRLHAWQQPLAPHRYFLSALLEPGSLVADPFCGSGTTVEACLRAGLRAVAAEADEGSYRVARGRILRVQRELAAGDVPSETR